LLSAFDTDVSIVVGLVDVLDIVIDVCSGVSKVVGRAMDIADGLDIVMEVVSDVVLEVSSVFGMAIDIANGLDMAITFDSDMAITFDCRKSCRFIVCLHTVPFCIELHCSFMSDLFKTSSFRFDS